MSKEGGGTVEGKSAADNAPSMMPATYAAQFSEPEGNRETFRSDELREAVAGTVVGGD